MNRIFACLRMIGMVFWVAGAYVRCAVNDMRTQPDPMVPVRLAKQLLRILGVRVNNTGHSPDPNKNPVLIAANHRSWLDIFVLLSLHPCGFIAKSDIARWPFLGRITRTSGCLFIERSRLRDIPEINRRLAERLKQGASMAFFPESRTSESILPAPFRAALFQAALEAHAPMMHIALAYTDAEGQPINTADYDTSLVASVWRIASQKNLHAQTQCSLPAIPTEDDTRHTLKEHAEAFIRGCLKNLDDKSQKT